MQCARITNIADFLDKSPVAVYVTSNRHYTVTRNTDFAETSNASPHGYAQS